LCQIANLSSLIPPHVHFNTPYTLLSFTSSNDFHLTPLRLLFVVFLHEIISLRVQSLFQLIPAGIQFVLLWGKSWELLLKTELTKRQFSDWRSNSRSISNIGSIYSHVVWQVADTEPDVPSASVPKRTGTDNKSRSVPRLSTINRSASHSVSNLVNILEL